MGACFTEEYNNIFGAIESVGQSVKEKRPSAYYIQAKMDIAHVVYSFTYYVFTYIGLVCISVCAAKIFKKWLHIVSRNLYELLFLIPVNIHVYIFIISGYNTHSLSFFSLTFLDEFSLVFVIHLFFFFFFYH